MKQVLTLALAVMCVVGYAQKKPKINKAMAAMEAGDLAEAKSIIDQASEYEKIKDEGKTWYYRGQIYAALDTAAKEPGAMEESVRSFKKAIELDPNQSFSSIDPALGIVNVDSKLIGYQAFYYEKGIRDYNLESFSTAADNFEKAFYIVADTNTILNAALSSARAADTARAISNYESALEAGAKEKVIYMQLYLYKVGQDKLEDALSVVRRAREVYPNDIEAINLEISLLINLDKGEEAKANLDKAISENPSPDLYFSRGILLEKMEKVDEALASYQKGVEMDPNHFNSNFNIGVLYFNQANELLKQRNNLGLREDKKYDQLTKEINAKMDTALPLWEKLYGMNNKDLTILETLGFIYSFKDMVDEYEKIQSEIDALN